MCVLLLLCVFAQSVPVSGSGEFDRGLYGYVSA